MSNVESQPHLSGSNLSVDTLRPRRDTLENHLPKVAQPEHALPITNQSPIRRARTPSRHRPSRVHDRHTIRDATVRHSRILAEAAILILSLLELAGLDLEEGRQLAPAVVTVAALWETLAEWDGALVEDEVDVAGWPPGFVGVARGAGAAEGLRGLDDFHVEACAERLHVRDDEGAVTLKLGGWEDGRELREAKGSEDGS